MASPVIGQEESLGANKGEQIHSFIDLEFLVIFPAPLPCDHKKLDVCMIVDASVSVRVPNYVRVKTFLTQFVHYFPTNTHFSLITYARNATLRCKFSDQQCQSAESTHDLIADIPDKLAWGTRTDRALIAADKIVFKPENGDRPDAENLVMVLTDGRTNRGSASFNDTIPPLRVGFVTFGNQSFQS